MNRTQRRSAAQSRGKNRNMNSGAPPAATREAALAAAVQRHQAGAIDDAIRVYSRVLTEAPDHPHALHLMGIATFQKGDPAAAAEYLQRAVGADPGVADFYASLGNALHGAGDNNAAEAAFANAVTLAPERPEFQFNLGVVRQALGRLAAAEDSYRQAIAGRPDYAEAHFNLALTCQMAGKAKKAEAAYRQVIALVPDLAEAHNNLGCALDSQGKREAAIAAWRHAVSLDAANADAHNNLGKALIDADAPSDAIAALETALRLRPDFAEAHANLGGAQARLGNFEIAETACRRAIALDNRLAAGHFNLGNLLKDKGDYRGARECFSAAIAVDPAHVKGFRNRALVGLALGEFSQGWRDYRARPSMAREVADFPTDLLPAELDGKLVLLEKDQGLGDELFFLRFVPALKSLGARIAYRPSLKIRGLIERLNLIDTVLAEDDAAPDADFVLSIGDLPFLLGHGDIDPPPPPTPIAPLRDRPGAVRRRLGKAGQPPYIALTWRAGAAGNKDILHKEVPLDALGAALAPMPGTILALQRNPEDGEIADLARMLGRDIHDFTDMNDDLEEMLALVGGIDAYVAVSNTNIHLAAAAGRAGTGETRAGCDIRLLVPNPPEFRWMAAGDISPWFPGISLYRQSADGDWSAAIERMAMDLAKALAEKSKKKEASRP